MTTESNVTEMHEKVSLEQATKEINQWLDSKRVTPRKRQDIGPIIDALVDGMMYGDLTISEDGTIKQNLKYPLVWESGEVHISELTYKPRIRQGEVSKLLMVQKSNDTDSRMMAYLGAATGQGISMLSKLDTSDYNVAQSIISFFL